MLTQVYELLITQLHIFSINFINVLSYYRCIHYLVFPALFPSTVWYLLTIRVLHLSQNIVNLQGCYLNDLKFFIMVAYTMFHAHVTYFTLKIALNIQVNVSNKPCLYLFACWHGCMYFFCQGLPILSIHLISVFSINCYACYQMIHRLF